MNSFTAYSISFQLLCISFIAVFILDGLEGNIGDTILVFSLNIFVFAEIDGVRC